MQHLIHIDSQNLLMAPVKIRLGRARKTPTRHLLYSAEENPDLGLHSESFNTWLSLLPQKLLYQPQQLSPSMLCLGSIPSWVTDERSSNHTIRRRHSHKQLHWLPGWWERSQECTENMSRSIWRGYTTLADTQCNVDLIFSCRSLFQEYKVSFTWSPLNLRGRISSI